MDSFVFVTVSTFPDEPTVWTQGLKKHKWRKNEDYQIVGQDTTWHGWHTRAILMLKWFAENSGPQTVAISDSTDVLVNCNKQQLFDAYKAMDRPLVVGAESRGTSKATPGILIKPHHVFQRSTGGSLRSKLNIPDNYTQDRNNNGFIIGERDALIQMYTFIVNYQDDQYGLFAYLETLNLDEFTIDFRSTLIYNYNELNVESEAPSEVLLHHFPGQGGARLNIVAKEIFGENNAILFETKSNPDKFNDLEWALLVLVILVGLLLAIGVGLVAALAILVVKRNSTT